MLKTPWSDVVADVPLSEYPRPQFRRESYLCLNGSWDYAIVDGLDIMPDEKRIFDGKILVPFSPEAPLSGVEKILLPTQTLIYRRTFTLPEGFLKDVLILNFGAVDYHCRVYINGEKIGENYGGYYPFSLDITRALREGDNVLQVLVEDPTDTSCIQRGKQSLSPSQIWYTPTSGIWQSVWLESLPSRHIEEFKLTPSLAGGRLNVFLKSCGLPAQCLISLHGREIVRTKLKEGDNSILIPNPEAWSPQSPTLYDMTLTCGDDVAESYFAMRDFGTATIEGKPRLTLNGKACFMSGVLDQGYWSDGLYTPPCWDAALYDIKLLKRCGFNTVRKHIKIEPMLWYYLCDREGLIVWQDMINGGDKYSFGIIALRPTLKMHVADDVPKNYTALARADDDGRAEFTRELTRMIDTLYNCPCIGLWTIFNEAWGQFESVKFAAAVKKIDPTRIIDHASGWYDMEGGDVKSIHRYALPFKTPQDARAVVLSEFGGYSHKVIRHVYGSKVFGYMKFKTLKSLNDAVRKLYTSQIIPSKEKGLCAAIFTQLSDVEEEINGIVTYDRQIEKIDPTLLAELNAVLID